MASDGTALVGPSARAFRVAGEDQSWPAVLTMLGLGLGLLAFSVHTTLRLSTAAREPPPAPPPAAIALPLPPPTPPPVEVPPPEPCAPTFQVQFAIGSARAKVPREDLEGLLAWLREHPSSTVVVDGHADAKGSMEGNLGLSFRRAKRVKRKLVRAGLSADRVTARAFGEYQPLAGAPPKDGANRRVVVRVDGILSCPADGIGDDS